MKFVKNLMVILIITVIINVSLFSNIAFAEWVTNVPGVLGTNIVDSVATSTGIVAAGQDGKLYFMTANSMGGVPMWELSTSPIIDDFAGVAYDGTNFWAVSVTGEIIKSSDGKDWTIISVPAEIKPVIAEKVVGIDASGGNVAIVTSAGGLVNTDGTDWGDFSSNLEKTSLATEKNIKGVKIFSDVDNKLCLAVFGHGDGTESNFYQLNTATKSLTGTNFAACGDINDLAINSYNDWIIVGAGGGVGKIFAGTDFADAASLTAVSVEDLSYNSYSPADIFSICYDFTNKVGFASGQSGLLLQIRNIGTSLSAVYVPQTTTTENLYTVASADGKKVFASGNNGASIYGSEVLWSTTTYIPDRNPAEALVSGDSKYFGVFGSCTEPPYYNVYVTDNNGDTWKVGSGVITKPADGGFYGKDVSDYFVSKTSPSELQVVKVDTVAHDSTGEKLTLAGYTYVSYAILGNALYAFANNDDNTSACAIQSANLSSIDSAASAVTTIAYNTISGSGTTAKGLYVLTTDNKIMVMVDDSNHLASVMSENFVEVESFKALLTSLNGDSLSLYSATDGKLILIDTTAGNIYVIDDSAVASGTDVSTSVLADSGYSVSEPIKLPGSNYSSPKFSGSSTYLAYCQGLDIYMHSSGRWVHYSGTDRETGYMASSGSGVMIANSGAVYPFFSVGPRVGNVLASTVSSPDNRFMFVYNASKTDVYVGSSEGAYHGTVKADTSTVVWDSERVGDGIMGTYKSFVFGYGDEVYALYWDALDNIKFARKNAESWEKLEPEGDAVSSYAVAVGDGLLYFCGSEGIAKVTVSGSTYAVTTQTALAGDVAMPKKLNYIAAAPTGDVLYGVIGKDFYKFSENSGDAWKVEKIAASSDNEEVNLLFVNVLSADKVYLVGSNGYAAFYDGKTVTRLEKPSSENLNCCWAYESKLYAAGNLGNVYEYNSESKKWSTSLIAAGSALNSISGSSAGGYLIVVGNNGVIKSTDIDQSGGGETSTEVQNGQGEPIDLVAEASHLDDDVAKLTKDFKTPAMTMIGLPKIFKSKSIVPASIHCFKYSVTPTEKVEVNKLELFKLLTASGSATSGSHINYSRLNAVPATLTDGTFWITDNTDKAMVSGESLQAGTVYSVNFAIKDGGKYDLDKTVNGIIEDPAVLGVSSGSGGSSSGCVFNPLNSMSIEWILLLLVPILSVFRSRFKK